MSADDNPRPRSHNSNNLSGTCVSTWADERQETSSFTCLSSESKEQLLSVVGFLFGSRMDCHNGPRRTASRVAVLKAERQACLREATRLDTETIITQNERDANYARQGWPVSALSQASPWTLSRIANHSQPNGSEESITKRVVVCRLHVDVLLQDLSPVPEFEAEVKSALGLSTRFETFQSLYQVFERWGDLIPLSFDVGTSLAITDLKSNQEADPSHMSNIEIVRLVEHKATTVSAQGIDLHTGQDASCASEIPIGKWSQVRVTKVAPVTALLSAELQTQLSQLRSSLLTYFPLSLGGDTSNGYAFDDISHALKTIKSITVYSTDRVNMICIAYTDGSYSPQRGTKKGFASVFDLEVGEFISEVFFWRSDSGGVSSIQFFTPAGRASQAYGGSSGRPMILKATGGLLAAFAGKIKNDSVHQLQGIWRHDIKRVGPSGARHYSEFHGTEGGCRLNDLPLLKHPSATISKVMVRHSNNRVHAIQVTYEYREGDHTTIIEGSHLGGSGGSESTFNLSAGEYITVVRGKTGPRIIQLCFATNLGRTSSIFGGAEGNEFVCQAPLSETRKTMRLYAIYGRSGSEVDGLAFAWAAV